MSPSIMYGTWDNRIVRLRRKFWFADNSTESAIERKMIVAKFTRLLKGSFGQMTVLQINENIR